MLYVFDHVAPALPMIYVFVLIAPARSLLAELDVYFFLFCFARIVPPERRVRPRSAVWRRLSVHMPPPGGLKGVCFRTY